MQEIIQDWEWDILNMKEVIKILKESDDAFVRSNTEKIEPILLKINNCIVSIVKK